MLGLFLRNDCRFYDPIYFVVRFTLNFGIRDTGLVTRSD
jgi:hypothetical protein